MFTIPKITLITILLSIFPTKSYNVRPPSVYETLSQNPEYETYFSLIKSNSAVKRNIIYSNITVFAPTNDAFDKYTREYKEEIGIYHIADGIYDLESFEKNAASLPSFRATLPPLWVTRNKNGYFVNNARVVESKSNHYSQSRLARQRYYQVLHTIDEVLHPFASILTNPTAYDILINLEYITKEPYSATNFLHKVLKYKKQHVYENRGSNTYFIPIDNNLDDFKLKNMDDYIVDCHVIPNQVYFTRTTLEGHFLETNANGDYILIMVSFMEKYGTYYVKSNTVLGDSDHKSGELFAEILIPNIPVQNGVVHIISQPLAIFENTLKPFPFLPILDKITMDPELNTTYFLGQKHNFNQYLDVNNKSLTYFAPLNRAWEPAILETITADDDVTDRTLGRHLVVSNQAYSIDKLYTMTIISNFTGIVMKTMSGPIHVNIIWEDGSFYILFNRKMIKITRADYICTNGVVHVIDYPLVCDPLFVVKPTKAIEEYSFWHNVKSWFI